MNDIINVDIQEENPIEIVEIYVDENAAQSAADSAELAQQIVAGIDQRNTILVNNNFDKTGTVFTGYANSEWNINGLVYLNPADVIHNIPLAVSGKQRWERIVLNTSNSFQRVPGDEVTDNPAMPSVPDDTLEYTFYLVTDSAVGDPTPPIVGSNYQSKGEKADAIYSLGSFEYISGTEASYVRIWNQDTGFLKAISVAAGNTYVYPGKEYTIKNERATALIIKHQDTTIVGSAYKKFWFYNGLDLVLQPGESATFQYSQGRFEMTHFNGESIQRYKIISANTTVDNTFHNCICQITSTCNITIPTGLRSDWNAVFDAVGSVTGTFVESGTTFSSPFGKKLKDNAMGSIYKTSTANFRLNGGFTV